ncbi:MAG TPA: zf-HC2 domain-containing protein [Planctomycetota bacterium]|nr:zf-HC2 domain-containing protein [Planctomycetota bacterium]
MNGPREIEREGGCGAVHALFVPYIDGEASPAERRTVEAHVATCPECARRLALHRKIAEALRTETSGSPGLEPGLAERVRVRARRGHRVRIAWLAGMAALLVVSSALLFWMASSPGGGPVGAPAPSDELIAALDILEALEAEGVEPTLDLVHLLLEVDAGDGTPRQGSDILDPSIFDDVLEEEL